MRFSPFVLLILTACASGSSQEESHLRARRAPQQVGTVRLNQTQQLPRYALGAIYRYRDEDFRPDVYIYPRDQWPDLRMQAFNFVDAIGEMRLRGRYESYDMLLDVPIKLNIGTEALAGHEIIFRIAQAGRKRDSYFAVIGLPEQYVKFRITQPTEPNAPVRAREFVSAWLTAYLAN